LQRPPISEYCPPYHGDVQKGLSFGSSALYAPWVFALPRFQGFFAITASADFSNTLILEISPGKGLKLSARAAKLSAIAPALLYLPHPWGRT